MAVVLIGTLDTKGRELAFVRDLLQAQGLETIVIDAGTLGPPVIEPDIGRENSSGLAMGSSRMGNSGSCAT